MNRGKPVTIIATLALLASACGQAKAAPAAVHLPSNLATIVSSGGTFWAEVEAFQHGQVIEGTSATNAQLATPLGTSTRGGLEVTASSGRAWAGEVAHGTLSLSAIYSGPPDKWSANVIPQEIPDFPGAVVASGPSTAYAVVGLARDGVAKQEVIKIVDGGNSWATVSSEKELTSLAHANGCVSPVYRSVQVISGTVYVLASCGSNRAMVADLATGRGKIFSSAAPIDAFSALVDLSGKPLYVAILGEAGKERMVEVGNSGKLLSLALSKSATASPSISISPSGVPSVLVPGTGSVYLLAPSIRVFAAPANALGLGFGPAGNLLVITGGYNAEAVTLYHLVGESFRPVKTVNIPTGAGP
jgi:hypothetical protein